MQIVYHLEFSGNQPETLPLFSSKTKAIKWAKTDGVEFLLNESTCDYNLFEEITGFKVIIDDEYEEEIVVKYLEIRGYDEGEEYLDRIPYETAYIKPVKVQ